MSFILEKQKGYSPNESAENLHAENLLPRKSTMTDL